MARSATHTTINMLSPSHSHPTSQTCKLYIYIKTKYFLYRLIPHDKKVNLFTKYVLIIYLLQTGKRGEQAQTSVNGGHMQAKRANNRAGANERERRPNKDGNKHE